MSATLPPEAQAKVQPFLSRWEAFEQKTLGRAKEVEAEAEAGLQELIGINPLDPNAISAGFSAVKSRYDGLRDKVEQAVEKLESEWSEATDDLELEEEQRYALTAVWSGIVNKGRALQRRLEQWAEKIEVKKNADWSRQLQGLAEKECSTPRKCPSCGAGIDVPFKHAHSAVRCPHCDSVNELDIGMATGLFYQGQGAHFLAREATFNEWLSQEQADDKYKHFSHPSNEDRQAFLKAVKDYWIAHFTALKKFHPGFPQTVEEAAQSRLAHYDAYDQPQEKEERAKASALLRLIKARDKKGLEAHLRECGDMEEAAYTVLEHGDREGAGLVLQLQYVVEGCDDDRAEWMREKMADLQRTLSQR